MRHTAVCGRDARTPRRAFRPREAPQGILPARPRCVTLLSAGETPAHPGGARTRTMSRDWSRCCLRARRLRTQAVRERAPCPVMRHTAVCGRDACTPRRAFRPREATEGSMPARPGYPRARDASHCCLRARCPRTQAGTHTVSSADTSGTSWNDCAAPRQECILIDQDLVSRGIRQRV